MKNVLIAALVMGAVAMAGCDDKKTGSSTVNQMKDSAGKTVDSMKDAAKSTMDAATTKVMDEVKGMVDTAKAKLDSLTKGGANLTAEKKSDFDKVMADLNGQFKSFSDGVASLKDMKAADLTSKLPDLKVAGTKLMDGIKAAAEKFGIKV
mgnify:CR=1 FL=1